MTRKTKEDHLLFCFGEESGEIQQVLGKIGRFGMYDSDPNIKKSIDNFHHLTLEVHDLLAVYEMLCDEINEECIISRRLIENKKKRVKKYMKYARKHGKLEKDK